MPIERVTLLSTLQWPENEYEGSAFFDYHGRELEARVILSGDEEWATWTKGRVIEGDVFLLRVGPVRRESRPPGLVDAGRASYEASGLVLMIEDAERIVLDVGFPLVVDMDPLPNDAEPMPGVGEAIFVYGEMQLCPED